MQATDLYTTLALAQDAVRRFDVNVTLSFTLANTARGTSAGTYRLTAKGNGIGTGETEGCGPSPESAIGMLQRATRTAWEEHRNAVQAARLARSMARALANNQQAAA
jgi:hypothetical protein